MGCGRKAEKSAQSSSSSRPKQEIHHVTAVPNVEKTYDKQLSKEVKPSVSDKTSVKSVEKTQPDSIQFPPRKEQQQQQPQQQQQQKTLKDVHEASSFVVAGEKTVDKDDFDNYLNNLGAK